MQTILSITYVSQSLTTHHHFLHESIAMQGCAKVTWRMLFWSSLAAKSKHAAMWEICRFWVVGVNKSRTLPKKTYVYFLFKYCLVHQRWGVQIGYISSRTNNLMTGNFFLCPSDDFCCYERSCPGRSKTYVTFDITEKSCTWSLTTSNVCDYWHFQSLVNV